MRLWMRWMCFLGFLFQTSKVDIYRQVKLRQLAAVKETHVMIKRGYIRLVHLNWHLEVWIIIERGSQAWKERYFTMKIKLLLQPLISRYYSFYLDNMEWFTCGWSSNSTFVGQPGLGQLLLDLRKGLWSGQNTGSLKSTLLDRIRRWEQTQTVSPLPSSPSPLKLLTLPRDSLWAMSTLKDTNWHCWLFKTGGVYIVAIQWGLCRTPWECECQIPRSCNK